MNGSMTYIKKNGSQHRTNTPVEMKYIAEIGYERERERKRKRGRIREMIRA